MSGKINSKKLIAEEIVGDLATLDKVPLTDSEMERIRKIGDFLHSQVVKIKSIITKTSNRI